MALAVKEQVATLRAVESARGIVADARHSGGNVFAIFWYLWRFVESLDQVPILIQKSANLRDLDRAGVSGRSSCVECVLAAMCAS